MVTPESERLNDLQLRLSSSLIATVIICPLHAFFFEFVSKPAFSTVTKSKRGLPYSFST